MFRPRGHLFFCHLFERIFHFQCISLTVMDLRFFDQVVGREQCVSGLCGAVQRSPRC